MRVTSMSTGLFPSCSTASRSVSCVTSPLRHTVHSYKRPCFRSQPSLSAQRLQGVKCNAEQGPGPTKDTVFGQLDTSEEPPSVNEKDFWEGESWEWLGTAAFFFVPAVLLLGVTIGFFAAGSYNNGAEVYLQPASSPESPATLTFPE